MGRAWTAGHASASTIHGARTAVVIRGALRHAVDLLDHLLDRPGAACNAATQHQRSVSPRDTHKQQNNSKRAARTLPREPYTNTHPRTSSRSRPSPASRPSSASGSSKCAPSRFTGCPPALENKANFTTTSARGNIDPFRQLYGWCRSVQDSIKEISVRTNAAFLV